MRAVSLEHGVFHIRRIVNIPQPLVHALSNQMEDRGLDGRHHSQLYRLVAGIPDFGVQQSAKINETENPGTDLLRVDCLAGIDIQEDTLSVNVDDA